MQKELSGKRIAILVGEDFDLAALAGSRQLLEEAGARTFIISPGRDKGPSNAALRDWAEAFTMDVPLEAAQPEEFDALLLHAGAANSPLLHRDGRAAEFVEAFLEAGKPVDAISPVAPHHRVSQPPAGL